jgi:hypothetical protein
MIVIRATWVLWRCKWGLIRLAAAAIICWALVADTGSRLARLQLAALPDFDHLAEVEALRLQGRYGEAEMVARAGLETTSDSTKRDRLQSALDANVAERDGWLRKVRSAGLGALSGRGTDLESIVGAVAADFFLVGDLRDIVIEGGKLVIDGDSDELVLLLSFIGAATTLAPEIDWVPSVLKAARRGGALGERMAEHLRQLLRQRKSAELASLCEDVATISRRASPGGAIRVMKLVDDPSDLRTFARFVERRPRGAFVLHVTGREGADTLRRAAKTTPDAADALLEAAAGKGVAGTRFLSTAAAKALTRPHPLVGVAKALGKGHAERLVTAMLDRIDPGAWWAVPLAAAWALFEALMLRRRFGVLRAEPARVRA